MESGEGRMQEEKEGEEKEIAEKVEKEGEEEGAEKYREVRERER